MKYAKSTNGIHAVIQLAQEIRKLKDMVCIVPKDYPKSQPSESFAAIVMSIDKLEDELDRRIMTLRP